MVGVELLEASQSARFQFGVGAQTSGVVLAGSEIAALLIGYCLGVRIPLPMRAKKTVAVARGSVVLDFVIAMSAPPRCQSSLVPSRRGTGNW